MQIRKLFLSAFGPFTGRVLDFSASTARLHLIYGPNEAGKSSALRAMGDLRFGIPLRSADNFIHDNAQLLLAGVFETASGAPLALARRKKNKDALTAADADTGEPLLQSPASAAVQQALAGGLDRARFELSFGLDHARLRDGGRQLVQGEGEVGAALFEASAGLQGVKALLATLQEDAKAYYGPRSAQAVIVDAGRQLEAHKQALKKALVRPDAWRERQRAVDVATDRVKTLQAEVDALRRRDASLAELRAVQPLLLQLDQSLRDIAALGGVPGLPADAREQRLRAEQVIQAADQQSRAAQAEIDACAEAQATLTLEPQLISHAAAIERLGQDFEAVRRQRAELLQARALLCAGTQTLAEDASRIAAGQGAEELLAAAPTAADRLVLDELLAEGTRLAQALADARARLARTELQREALPQPSAADLPPAVTAALEAALQQTAALGDGDARLAQWRREVQGLAQRLAQALADIGVATLAPLEAARPLLPAEITQAEQRLATLAHQRLDLEREDAQLRQELQIQSRRQQQLAAVGEIVTAQSLQAARAHRHTLWLQVKPGLAAPETVEAFEQAQAEADRQADLLREGAERAAQAAECALRIGENHAARQALVQAETAWAADQAAVASSWQTALADAGLPALAPEVLRDWQARREAALALGRQHADALREEADADLSWSAAQAALRLALQAAGQAVAMDADPAVLARQARHWLQQQVESAARRQAHAAQQQQLRIEHVAAEREAAARAGELGANAAAQAGWTTRLWLPPGSSPSAIKARLAELAALAQARAAQRQHQATIDKLQALEAALADDAAALATLLQEPAEPGHPAVVHLGDFIDRLLQRSAQASASAVQAAELARRRAAAQRQFEQAMAQAQAGGHVLQRLCDAAGVASIAGLADAEALAEQGRALQADVQRLTAQLAAASHRPLEALRNEVAALDVAGTDAERARLAAALPGLQSQIDQATEAQLMARQAFEAIDTSGAAAEAREAMESAAARYRAALQPWAQLKMAESLLQEALRRFRERAQGPMVTLASEYFGLITGGRYARLRVDEAGDKPALQAVDAAGVGVGIEAMSEGTADQLYLALRLAALELQRSPERAMPLVLDDVLMTSDDERARQMFKALARFAEGGQVLLFTHHRHLVPLAQAMLPAGVLAVHHL